MAHCPPSTRSGPLHAEATDDLEHLCWIKLALNVFGRHDTADALDQKIIAAHRSRLATGWLSASPYREALTVLALASLKRRGYAVTAVLVVFTETELEDAYASLFAAGIQVLPLKSEAELPRLDGYGVARCIRIWNDPAHADLPLDDMLTERLVVHLLDSDAVRELDFGSLASEAAQNWAPQARQRVGVIAFNPRTWRGIKGAVRHIAIPKLLSLPRRIRRRLKRRKAWR